MSFTSVVKNEISKLESKDVDSIAELSAILKNLATTENGIKILTENASVARRVFNLIKDLYGITLKITVRRGTNFKKNNIYILETTKKTEEILDSLSIIKDGEYLTVPDTYILDDVDTKRAYLRGLFMAAGTVNDPKKSRYHLEFDVTEEEYAKFLCALLKEFYINSKYIKRESKYMVYVKEAEKIGDFLRIINATHALLYFEDIRIYRDHKNMTNRLNNCEQANVDKIINTATEQLKDIEIIENEVGLDFLDDKLKIAATYRKKYPDASLVELAEIVSLETDIKLSKSGLYHRLNNIKKIAKRINTNKKD